MSRSEGQAGRSLAWTGDAVRRAGRRVRARGGDRQAGREDVAARRPAALDDREEAAVAVGLLTGQPRQGRIGVGWSALSKLDVPDADEPSLEVLEVDRWLSDLAAESGPDRPVGDDLLVGGVLSRDGARAAPAVGRVQRRAAPGSARRGDGRRRRSGAGVPVDEVRRPHVLGRSRRDRRQAFTGGVEALRTVTLVPGHAVGPMLARPGGGVGRGARRDGRGVGRVEARRRPIQAHRATATSGCSPATSTTSPTGCRVSCLVAGLPGGDLVLDGEVARGRPTTAAATVPGHDGRLQRPGATGTRRWAGGLLLRRPPRRRRGGRRRAAVGSPERARRSCPAPFRLPSIVTADAAEAARSWTTPSAPATKG